MNEYADIWLGADNAVPLVLYSQGAVQDLSGTTRVTVNFGGSPATIIDSSTSPTAFDWTTEVEYPFNSGTTVDALILKFGDETITEGEYPHCILKIYDAANPDGVVFTSDLKLKVRS